MRSTCSPLAARTRMSRSPADADVMVVSSSAAVLKRADLVPNAEEEGANALIAEISVKGRSAAESFILSVFLCVLY